MDKDMPVWADHLMECLRHCLAEGHSLTTLDGKEVCLHCGLCADTLAAIQNQPHAETDRARMMREYDENLKVWFRGGNAMLGYFERESVSHDWRIHIPAGRKEGRPYIAISICNDCDAEMLTEHTADGELNYNRLCEIAFYRGELPKRTLCPVKGRVDFTPRCTARYGNKNLRCNGVPTNPTIKHGFYADYCAVHSVYL